MSSNKGVFYLQDDVYWQSMTLERCNIVKANEADPVYVISISDADNTHHTFVDDSPANRYGATFVVSEEPFSAAESVGHTIINDQPLRTRRALNKLQVLILDQAGSLATINNPSYISMRIEE